MGGDSFRLRVQAHLVSTSIITGSEEPQKLQLRDNLDSYR